MNKRAKIILDFWFIESKPEDWFKKNKKFDNIIKELFINDYEKAIKNEYDEWQDNPNECLALIILLDQFSRNLFRNSSRSFAQDHKSRLIVKEGVDRGYLEKMSLERIHFFLLPLIHSEDISDHKFGHNLVDTYLKKHKKYNEIKKVWNDHSIAIKKFGRYPHRNKLLRRISTSDEENFLKLPDSSW
ncbi:MAG: hypothetical protein CFH19_01109 [Alphaproteobacteria bacterium MarineAlpha5_Bin9]|nr:MAG: hypothetical protein CFH19_01109 [Alphaproteobacteria bacterium MarineAlpha5_Bin9]|tara:strand:- start:32657 stop:33217 length:561 start_codon:yes stop_codon:yes gene_type:complete